MTYEGLPVVIRKQTNSVISWGHSGIAFEHAGIISGITKATADNKKVIPACVF